MWRVLRIIQNTFYSVVREREREGERERERDLLGTISITEWSRARPGENTVYSKRTQRLWSLWRRGVWRVLRIVQNTFYSVVREHGLQQANTVTLVSVEEGRVAGVTYCTEHILQCSKRTRSTASEYSDSRLCGGGREGEREREIYWGLRRVLRML